MNDTRQLASLIDEHTRLFTADYDSRDDESVAFERVDEILPELRERCELLEPAPEDDALFEVLVGALESEDSQVHDAAYIGLGRIGHPQVIPLLLERINHGKSRFGRLITWAEEADAQMARTLRLCLDRMPGHFEDRVLAEVAVHLAETRNGAPRDSVLLRRALATSPNPLKRWVTKMVETIRTLDVEELADDARDEISTDLEFPVLERITAGIAPDGWVHGLVWSADGTRIYVGVGAGDSGGLRTYDREGELLEGSVLDDRKVTDLALSNDGRWLAVAACDGRSAIVDTHHGEVVREVDEALAATTLRVAFSPDDRHVAFSGNHVVVLACEDWSVVETFSLPVDPVVRAARDWLIATSSTRKGALKALGSLEVTPKFRFVAEKVARGAHRWGLLSDSLPDSRPNALAWLDPNTLLVGGQAVFEKRLGEPLRCVHTPSKTTAPMIWPDSRVVGLGCNARHVWVATRDGLARYDQHFENERLFPEVRCGSIIIVSHERAFVGCYGRAGLWCIEGDDAKRLPGPVDVRGVAVRNDGSVWCGDRIVTGWDADLTPLDGPQHTESIVGIFEDAEGHAVTCDAGGNIVRHGSGSITKVADSKRCISAGASPGAEWIALGFETARAGELAFFRGDELMWRKTLGKGKPWCPILRDEHVFFVADSKLVCCTFDDQDVQTRKLGKPYMRATPLGDHLVAYGDDRHLMVVSLTDQEVIEQRELEERLNDIAGTPDGRWLCVAFEHGTVDVIDVATMQLHTVVRTRFPGVITCTNEALYITSRGRLLRHAFGTSAVEIVGELPLERPSPRVMAVVDDEVWIGDHSGLLTRAPANAGCAIKRR